MSVVQYSTVFQIILIVDDYGTIKMSRSALTDSKHLLKLQKSPPKAIATNSPPQSEHY